MSQNNELRGQDEQPILSLIQRIKDGTVAPETLSKDLRQRCVEVLLAEGYTIAAMAQILKRSEKTIKRDIDDIREQNAISPDIDLAKKIIGEMVMYARINRDYLMKLARTKESSVAEKAQSEYYAFKVHVELMTKLQSMGYLPQMPQAIVGDVFHHLDHDNLDFDDLARQVIEIEKISDGDGNIKDDIGKMKAVLNSITPSDKNQTQKEEQNEDAR